jgi:hypothetical protein
MRFVLVFLLFATSAIAGRPDAAFSFKDTSCVCRDDKAMSKGDCVNTCHGKNTKGADVLFADFDVTSSITNGPLKNVKNWCYKYLLGDTAFPKCAVEATDELGKKSLLQTFSFPKNNSLSVDVTTLEDDHNYTFRLVEQTSKTASFPYDVYIFDPVGVPLKQSALSQYSCIPRNTEVHLHFYYSAPKIPGAVNGTFVCHDTTSYGPVDRPEFPRFENISSVATLWGAQNSLFFDNNGDGVLDVNEYYASKAKEYGGATKGHVRLFGNLTAPGTLENNTEAGNLSFRTLGFVMSYWVDAVTFTSYCPDEDDFASGKPEYKAIKDIVGTNTEGLYVADRSESEMHDYLFVRESDLRAVWFYMKNGVPTKPTEDIIPFQTIYFHYPFNKKDPYVKSPNQKIYRLRSVQETGTLTSLQAFIGSSGEMISYPAHDKKIACVPRL